MEFSLRDLLYLGGILASVIISFLGTRHKMKEYVRDTNEDLKNKMHDLELKMSALKTKDELQQQIIDLIGKQMDDLVSKLFIALKEQKTKKK